MSTTSQTRSGSHAFVPASLATVGYSLFALQQDVPLADLQPIVFQGISVGNLPADVPSSMLTGSGAVLIEEPTDFVPEAAAQETTVDTIMGGPVNMPGGNVGMFTAAPVDAPVVPEPPKPSNADMAGSFLMPPDPEHKPRAAVTIGLLKEISFLDE